jgi:phage gpG-like protein
MSASMRIVSGGGVAGMKFRTIASGMGGPIMANALHAGAMVGASAARDNVNEQGLWNTGDFARRIEVQSATPRRATYGTNHPGAAVQEFGGTIRPKSSDPRARLHFYVDGEEVFARKVTVPARPYMRPSADENKGEIEAAIAGAVKAGIEALS